MKIHSRIGDDRRPMAFYRLRDCDCHEANPPELRAGSVATVFPSHYPKALSAS